MVDFPNRLVLLPLLIIVFGFIGIFSLYGISCELSEEPTEKIEWVDIEDKKRIQSVNDLRIDDVISYIEGNDNEDGGMLNNEGLAQRGFGGMIGGENRPKDLKFKPIARTKSSESLTKSFKAGSEFTPEEDDTRKIIEAHFRGRAMNINFDTSKGEIIITYKNVNKNPALFDVLLSKQMVYLYLR